MTSKSRYFLLGASMLLLIGLGGGLIAYFSASRLQGPRAGLPAELRYVPADAALVAYADVRAVVDSEFRRGLESVSKDPKEGPVEIHDFAGVDVEKQVDHVVAYLESTDKSDASDQQPPRALVFVQGTFEVPRIEQFIRDHGGTIEDYNGKRIATHRSPPRQRVERPRRIDPNEQPNAGPPIAPSPPAAPPPPPPATSPQEMAVGFVEPGLIALGQAELVRRALDLSNNAAVSGTAKSVDENAELMELMREAWGSTAWVVGSFDAVSRRIGIPPALTQQVPPVRLISARANIDGGVKATLKAETANDAAADQVRDVVRGFISLIRLQAGTKPELEQTLRSLELSGFGNTVQLSFTVTPETLKWLHPPRPPDAPPR